MSKPRRKPHGTLTVQLPFSGFYESMWSQEIDREEEMEVENWEERQSEDGVPPELRVPDDTYAEMLADHTDYSAAYMSIARWYAEAFGKLLGGDLGIDLNLQLESMQSPREYNFGTDRVFAYISKRAVRELWKISKADGHRMLDKASAERHTSRSGFASYYRPDRADWPADPTEWDHNQLETLLLAVVALTYGEARDGSIEDQLFDAYACDGDAGYYDWSEAVDWAKVDAAVDDWREERLAEMRREAEADGVPFVEPPYRCQDTIDMFTGRAG